MNVHREEQAFTKTVTQGLAITNMFPKNTKETQSRSIPCHPLTARIFVGNFLTNDPCNARHCAVIGGVGLKLAPNR